jgi:DNA-binding SARP family transcriptional activator
MRTVVILAAFSLAVFGQRHKMEEVDTEKPGGKLLQQILQENDPSKKTALMEQFATEFPKLETTAWVLEQLQGIYVKAGDPDKTIAAGERLLAIDPDDPEAALQCLKAAETKKDVAQIKKWSAATSANARKLANSPKPADAEQAESWKSQVDYAKQVDTYSDYALFSAALQSRDPKATIELAEILAQRSPQGEYTAKVQQPLFVAYRQAGANDKAVALAERVLATDQNNEDMLLVVTDSYLQNKKDPEKIHAYSAKIVEVMGVKAKPEGTSDADWAAHKSQVTGLAYYMNGKQYAVENKHSQVDQELKKALPLVESSPALTSLKPELLFLLAFADYKLASASPEKAQDAANYFRACAALKSGYQTQAAANLKKIQTEYHGIK